MRNWITGAAAALAVVAAPTVASAQATGYIDLGYVNSSLEQFGSDVDIDTVVANGVVAFDMNNGVGLQIDARIGNAEPEVGGDIDFWSLGAHVYTRQNNWLFGGYVGIGNVDGGGADSDEWTIALETQYYMNRTTFSGAVSYSEADDADLEATALDLGVQHFVTDNFAIGAYVGFGNIESTGADTDVTTIGVQAEWQMATLPISIFGGYQRNDVDDAGIEVDSFNIGVRYNWGGTLYDRNRSGAGLQRRPGVFSRLLGAAL